MQLGSGFPKPSHDECEHAQAEGAHDERGVEAVGRAVAPKEEVFPEALDGVVEALGGGKLNRGARLPAGRGGVEVDPAASAFIPDPAPGMAMGATDEVFAVFQIPLDDGVANAVAGWDARLVKE